MSLWSLIRVVLLAIPSFGYWANGAQAHLHISAGETLGDVAEATGSARFPSRYGGLTMPGNIRHTEHRARESDI